MSGMRWVAAISGCVLSALAAEAADLRVATIAASDPALPPWILSSTSELSYSFFSGSRAYPAATATNTNRGSGNQVYLENSYSLSGNPSEYFKLDMLLKSGYVKSEQTTGGFTGRYKGSTDTVVTTTITYLGVNGIQPYLSLNFNLPTGQPALYGFGGRARLDPDLVPVPTFGEGFNFGPTIGANIPINTNLMLNVSGGVTLRESYYREGPFVAGLAFPLQRSSKYDPGTLSSLSASATYTEGAFYGQLSVGFSSSTTAYVDDIATSRSGNRATVGLVTQYGIMDGLTIAFNGSASFAGPNYAVHPDTPVPASAVFPNSVVVFPNGILTQEDRNSNNKTFQGKLSLTYAVLPELSVSPFVNILYRDKNSYDPVLNLFIPQKTRYSLGTTASYAITDKISLTGRVEHIRTFERGSPDKFDALFAAFNPGMGFMPGTSNVPLSYYGWQIAGGVTFNF